MEPKPNFVATYIAPYWKALVAFVTPGVPLLIAANLEGSPGGSSITGPEAIVAVLTMVATAGAVYAAPKNKTQPSEEGNVV